VVPDVLKEYNDFIFKLKEVPKQFHTQHGWMRCVREGLTGWRLVGKVVSQAGGCGRGLDVQL
jgi:hypothetical protein